MHYRLRKKWHVLLCIPLEETFQVMVNYVSIMIRTVECYKGWWKPQVETGLLWLVLQTSWPVAGWSQWWACCWSTTWMPRSSISKSWYPSDEAELKRSPTVDACASLPKLPRLLLQNIFGKVVMEEQKETMVKVGDPCTMSAEWHKIDQLIVSLLVCPWKLSWLWHECNFVWALIFWMKHN